MQILLAAGDPVASSNPWTPIITGCFVILGALISLGSTWFMEWRKANRELARRFDADLAKHGAEFLLHADDLNEQIKLRRTPVRSIIQGDPRPEEVAERETILAAAIAKGKESTLAATRALDILSFVAPEAVKKTAQEHLSLLGGAFAYADFSYQSTQDVIARSREKVVVAVREALAMPTAEAVGTKTTRLGLSAFWKNEDGSMRSMKTIAVRGGVSLAGVTALLFTGNWLGDVLGGIRF